MTKDAYYLSSANFDARYTAEHAPVNSNRYKNGYMNRFYSKMHAGHNVISNLTSRGTMTDFWLGITGIAVHIKPDLMSFIIVSSGVRG